MRAIHRARKGLFAFVELLRSWCSHRPPYKILFSNSSWETELRRSFQFTRHQIVFDDLTDADLGAYDLIVPLNIADILFLSDRRQTLPQQLIPLPSRESVELCNDKKAFNAFLIARGFGHLIPAMGPALQPPFILKQRIGAYSENCHLIRDVADERRFVREISSDAYFTQALILGREEFATHICFKNQQVLAHLNLKYVFSHDTPIKGQDSQCYTQLGRCRFLDVWSEILSLVQFEGLCCVNYKIVNGRPLLFEINPRFGASLALFFFSFLRHIDGACLT